MPYVAPWHGALLRRPPPKPVFFSAPKLSASLVPLFDAFVRRCCSTPLFELSALIMAHGPPMAMREIGDNVSFGAVRAPSRRNGPTGAQGADPGLARPAPMLPP
jgi:hypothetical protein